MANKAISELPQAQNVNNQDLFVLEQSGIAKKLTAETFITEQGIIDALAEALDGHGGISSVTLSSVSGRIRTYRITFTDQSATTFQVYDGTSIDRISRTSSSGLDDVYTIFLSDGTTTFFTVHNGADGTVSEAMLNDALKNKAPAITETTESSAIANFPDGADDMPLHNILAEINPVQDLTYGDPYPAGGGNQIIPFPYYDSTKTLYGVTFTVNNDGSILLTGTVSGGTAYFNLYGSPTTPIPDWMEEGETYYISPQLNSSYFTQVIFYGSTNRAFTNQSFIVPTKANYTGFAIVIGAYNGAVYGTSGVTVYPMLNKGSTKLDFAPYSNICPITGHTEVNVTRTGANIWDEEWRNGYHNATSGIFVNHSSFLANAYPVYVKGSTTYYFASSYLFELYEYDKQGNFLRRTTNLHNSLFTTKSNTAYINFNSQRANDETTYNHDISINYPSTDTAYHAYQGSNTVTLSWQTEAGTVYGGTIDVATGLLTVNRAMVDMGTLTWSKVTSNYKTFVGIVSGIKYNYYWKTVMSSSYAGTSGKDASGSADCYIWTDSVSTVAVKDTSKSDMSAADFKAAMSGVQLVYELATPQTYQLTPQEDIKTLLGTNNVWADTGNVSVTYPADTKMFIEKLTMPTEDDLVANQAITSGKYFMVGNSLYLALANIASGAQITIGTNAQRVSLADALNTINS